jgi:purine-binding chemotaxis protein CheW
MAASTPSPTGVTSAAVVADQQIVLCDLAGETYGVDIARVEEIIRLPPITAVPRASHAVEGVINLRGTIIPVVDLRRALGLRESAATKSTRVIVADVGEHTIGMIVDAVSEVLRVPAAAIEPPSAIVTDLSTTYLRGIAKLAGRLVLLLDLEAALHVA